MKSNSVGEFCEAFISSAAENLSDILSNAVGYSLSLLRFAMSVKHGILIIGFASCAAVVVLSGCSPSSRSTSNTYQLPWSDDVGNYRLQKVQITTFDNPSGLSGKYGQVLVHPHDDQNQQLADSPAAGHFLKAGNTEIAADVLSLQAATIYAHIERLHQLDTLTGAASAIHWPLTYGLEVKTTDGTVSNALYDPARNAVVIMPYAEGRLPIAINGGILAHEHFHSIFQALVMSGLPKDSQTSTPGVQGEWSLEAIQNSEAGTKVTTDPVLRFDLSKKIAEIPLQTYNYFVIHGINEGLADFYGWVYSGDPSFIENSLPVKAVALRKMNVEVRSMPSAELWKSLLRAQDDPSKIAPMGFQLGEAYVLGTYYSTFLRALAIQLTAISPTVNSKLDQGSASGSAVGSARGSQVFFDSAPAFAQAPALASGSGSGSDSGSDSDLHLEAVAGEVVVKDLKQAHADLPLTSAQNARALGGVSVSAVEARAVLARALIAALPDLQKEFAADYKTVYINPVVVVEPLFAQLALKQNLNVAMCTLAQEFIAQSAALQSMTSLNFPAASVPVKTAVVNLMPNGCAGLVAPPTSQPAVPTTASQAPPVGGAPVIVPPSSPSADPKPALEKSGI